MSNKLREMASLSAGKREENIYKVFAYLHTREQFHPVNLRTRVVVSDKTIASYLRQIQEAQCLTEPYRKRLLELEATQSFKTESSSAKELSILDRLEKEWLKLAKTVESNGIKTERRQQLEQFVFTKEDELETLWQRLEFSMLFFELVKS